MKPKTLVTLVFAVGCGVVTMFLLRQMSSKKDVKHEPTVPVLMAETDIQIGRRIAPEWVRFREIPESAVPEGAITDVEQYKERALVEAAIAGEILKISKFGKPGDWGTSVLIPDGMRVVAIPVTDSDSFSGMLQPGDRVDVDVTYDLEQRDLTGRRYDITKNKVLLEYVQVFAVDNRTVADGPNAEAPRIKSVSLIVTPEQKGWLKLAQEKGKLSIAWRKESDNAEVKTATLEEGLIEELNGAVGNMSTTTEPAATELPAYTNHPETPSPGSEKKPTASPEGEFNFGEFLAQAKATSTPPAPAKPKGWTIEIIHGGATEKVEVPLPQPEVDADINAEADAKSAADPTETAGRMLRNLFGL